MKRKMKIREFGMTDHMSLEQNSIVQREGMLWEISQEIFRECFLRRVARQVCQKTGFLCVVLVVLELTL